MGKRIRAPKGFLTPMQVSEIARKKGFVISPTKLSRMAHAGIIPFAEPIPKMQRGIMFPTSKVMKVIAAAPKKSVLSDGSASEYGLQKRALRENLKLYSTTIRQTIARIEAGKEPPAIGLARDLWHLKHPYLIPTELANRILNGARARKMIKQYEKDGKVVSVENLAGKAGLSKEALLKSRHLSKVIIGKKAYVLKEDATDFLKRHKGSGKQRKR